MERSDGGYLYFFLKKLEKVQEKVASDGKRAYLYGKSKDMIAQFKVLDGTQVVNQYEMEYSSAKELHDLFHEARKVWAEFMVEVEWTELATMSYSCTYARELEMQQEDYKRPTFSEWREQEIQWEYMNGAYED